MNLSLGQTIFLAIGVTVGILLLAVLMIKSLIWAWQKLTKRPKEV